MKCTIWVLVFNCDIFCIGLWYELCSYVNVHFICSGSPPPSSMQKVLERGQGQAKNNVIPKGRPHTLYICGYLLHWSVGRLASCSLTTEVNSFNEIRHALNLSCSVHMSDKIRQTLTIYFFNSKLQFRLYFTDTATKSLCMPCQFQTSLQPSRCIWVCYRLTVSSGTLCLLSILCGSELRVQCLAVVKVHSEQTRQVWSSFEI